ncbi:MAG TPA: GNAT family N-acetyltransferase [Thermomonas sp.]|nr:GNAT family N-acetyltransferase [Thermomonas sp.]
MTDPSNALASLQAAFEQGGLSFAEGRVDPNLRFYLDTDLGVPRFVYCQLDGRVVSAYACFVPVDQLEGLPCFQVGYAVPEPYRGQGRATNVVNAGIVELRNGFSGYPPFWVEAVVGLDNLASQKVAAKILTTDCNPITDQVSGLPALQYLRQFATGS